jgi:uncharacterized protein YnzC (UPF0291/DUF896 family)
MFPKSRKALPPMSVEAATDYVRTMVQRESRGPGDLDNAMQRLEQRYGLPFWSLWYLRKGKAKTVEASLLARIRGAYLDMCQRQANTLLHEIKVEAATGNDLDSDIAAELEALLAKIQAKKASGKVTYAIIGSLPFVAVIGLVLDDWRRMK